MRVGGPHVAVVNEDNQIEMRPVTLGRNLGSRVTVIAGIQGDEKLVINPGDDLSTGVSVQIGHGEPGKEVVQR
jgi:multidrug efflux pump subunit AcrA (membrane-fusion protein)